MASTDKRTRIVETAARLVHEHGFGRTSLADIARESGVPLGNLYYYFKTKEAIADAVIEQRASLHAELREKWDRELEPRQRIEAFIQSSIDTRDLLTRNGCPVGSLCVELNKDHGSLAKRATRLFDAFLRWLEAQFRAMGKGSESRDLAHHVVASLQGAAVLAQSFQDPRHISRESIRLKHWVRSL